MNSEYCKCIVLYCIKAVVLRCWFAFDVRVSGNCALSGNCTPHGLPAQPPSLVGKLPGTTRRRI